MIDDDRFLASGTPEQRRLLESTRLDVPAPETRERLFAAIGLTATPAALSFTSEAAGTSLPAPPAPGLPGHGATQSTSLGTPLSASLGAPASGLMPAIALKWLAVASLSFGVGLGGGFLIRDRVRHTPPPSGAVSPGPPAPVTLGGPAQGALTAEAPLASVRTEATLPLPPPRHNPSPSASATAATLGIEREIELVQKARAAQKSQDPRACLSYLAMRQQLVNAGVLQPEATVLRIEALRSLGELEVARSEALRFFHTYPDSPLVKRIAGLLPDDPLSAPFVPEPSSAR